LTHAQSYTPTTPRELSLGLHPWSIFNEQRWSVFNERQQFISFSMLCTSANSFHCPFTFVWPRKVKRSSPLLWRTLPKTGSTVAKRSPYGLRPGGLSVRSRMRGVSESFGMRVCTDPALSAQVV